MEKALRHFISANKMIEEGHVQKPLVLFYLALVNYQIGNVALSYKITQKAKRNVDLVIKNNPFLRERMKDSSFEEELDGLINYIKESYPQIIMFIDEDDDNFNENTSNFSHVSQYLQSKEMEKVVPSYSFDSLTDEVMIATFTGLCRNDDELVFFDKLKGDVLMQVQGYLCSMTEDTAVSDRKFYERLKRREPADFIDKNRYILIDRLPLVDFLDEYRRQSRGREPFTSFTHFFAKEIMKEFSYNHDITVHDLVFSSYIQDKFHKTFSANYGYRFQELKNQYVSIFESTVDSLVESWLKRVIFDGEEKGQKSGNEIELDFVFKSSDHLRYQDDIHVSGPHGGAARAIKVEPNINGCEGYNIKGGEGYIVTVYNLDGNHPIWQNNVQMTSKPMNIVSRSSSKIVLRGYRVEAMSPFGWVDFNGEDYGLSIYLENNKLEKCILHMHDRNVDIEYLP